MARVPDDERCSIVDLSLKGCSQQYIGALVIRPLKTVNRIIQAYKYEGRIQNAPRAPHPKATTDDEDTLIVAAAVRNPILPAPAIREDLDLDLSDITVRRRLRTAGLRSRVAAQKLLLTASHKDARRQFAELHEECTSEEWGRVIFSDESTFSTRQDQRLRVWRLPGTRLFPDGDYLFQQDRSPLHMARAVKEFQAEHHMHLLEWPPKGADLNEKKPRMPAAEKLMLAAGFKFVCEVPPHHVADTSYGREGRSDRRAANLSEAASLPDREYGAEGH
nr:uncharacterized protein LOC119173743 [Rhipicephalus microplus]